jgi:hypothetical protein
VKRLIGIAVLTALVVTAVAVVMPVGAKSENGLVYNGVLGSIPDSVDVLDRGEVKIWADGKVKVEIKVANAVNQTYVVLLEWGGPDAREVSRLGEITTDGKGHAIQFYDLADLSPLPPGPVPGPLPTNPIIASPDVIVASGPQPAASLFIPAVENPLYTP